jgi:two-component system response regulator NreC
MIKVIIVDDQLLFRMGARGMIECHSDISIIGEAGSGKDFFSLLETTQPDIILLDIVLPDMTGIEIARRLKKERPEIRILAVSSENTDEKLRALMDIGIEGFICKRYCTDNELPAAIRSIMDGFDYFGRDISTIIYNVYVAQKKTAEVSAEFSEREREIIILCHEGLQAKEIADRLAISPKTVAAHKDNIFRRLGFKRTHEMLQYALKKGIIKMN